MNEMNFISMEDENTRLFEQSFFFSRQLTFDMLVKPQSNLTWYQTLLRVYDIVEEGVVDTLLVLECHVWIVQWNFIRQKNI